MPEREFPSKFKVAFSFAGEQRDLVRAIARAVQAELGPGTVFFDEWFEYYIAGHDADLKLQKIYGEASDLVVVCVSRTYERKPWTLAEHEAIRARLMKVRPSPHEPDRLRILPIRVGDGDVEGIPFNAIVPEARGKHISDISALILKRLRCVLQPPASEDQNPTASTSSAPTDATPRRQKPVLGPELAQVESLTQLLSSPQSPFHCGPWVPPDFFVGRHEELAHAEQLIRTGQNFVVVGPPRAGKTSFCRKLMSDIIRKTPESYLLSYMNLEQGSQMSIEAFMEHTILCIVGEVARQVFGCRYSDLLRKNPAEGYPSLEGEILFQRFVNIFRLLARFTHRRGQPRGRSIVMHEFVSFTSELLEITKERQFQRFVIFYDEANRLPRDISLELLNNIGEALSQTGLIGAYAASPELATSCDKLPGLFGNHIRLGPFRSEEDMLRLIARYYFNREDRWTELPISKQANSYLWGVSSGRPYPIQLLAEAMFGIARRAGASRIDLEHVTKAYDDAVKDRPEAFGKLT